MNDVLNSPEMGKLLTIVEEATRSTDEGVKYFVEPAAGTLQSAVNRRHHIIFGRRGSGKSSLLKKAAADLTLARRPIAKVDLEAFKGHSYPDLLLSVLIASLKAFKQWLQTAAVTPSNWSWWNIFGQSPTTPSYNKKQCKALEDKVDKCISDLESQLHLNDQSAIQMKQSETVAAEAETEDSLGVSLKGVSVGMKDKAKGSASAQTEIQESFKREKVDYLKRHIMDYQAIFDEMVSISNGDSYLFLDDLYHIRRDDQARVVDYFHSIGKGHRLWLKIGTIRHRSRWYVNGDPPLGVKLGDDADAIDLDLTLEKYALAKDFLLKVLENFSSAVSLEMKAFITDGALDRLVLASGGVARDFLTIFRRSVHIAREKKLEKITAEEINEAAGEYDTTKKEELKRDTYKAEEIPLIEVLNEIQSFCLDKAESNCFLVDKDATGSWIDAINELVDLKLLHLVRSRVTVSKKQGKIFNGYMLDLSQYTGSRARRGVTIVEFWKADSTEQLRKVSLIFEPGVIEGKTDGEIESRDGTARD
jgi:hypothetical protein